MQKIVVGPGIEARGQAVSPFYISLTLHDQLIHNCMLDSGASHNLMPKAIMYKFGLDITRPYKDLFSFDSKKVKMHWNYKRRGSEPRTNPFQECYDGRCGG